MNRNISEIQLGGEETTVTITPTALKEMVEIFKGSHGEVGLVYSISPSPVQGKNPWNLCGGQLAHVQGVQEGTATVNLLHPTTLEGKYMLGTDDSETIYGVGHTHPPGHGPLPSSVGSGIGMDLSIMRTYRVFREAGEQSFPSQTADGRRIAAHQALVEQGNRERIGDGHLFIAPYERSSDQMVVGLAYLREERGKMSLVYQPMRLKGPVD